jgi:DNA repair photolyase
MSLPTLNEKLARVYEPHAPSPQKRLDTLRAAKEAGLHVYVALAPTYPECDEEDIRRTLSAIKELDPVTIYHEPINIRAQNAQRIAEHAKSLGITVNTGVFETKQAWAMYALTQLFMVERIADEMGLRKQLHLWPDADLRKHAPSEWLNQYWGKVSDWPLTNFPGDLSCGRPDELSQQSES